MSGDDEEGDVFDEFVQEDANMPFPMSESPVRATQRDDGGGGDAPMAPGSPLSVGAARGSEERRRRSAGAAVGLQTASVVNDGIEYSETDMTNELGAVQSASRRAIPGTPISYTYQVIDSGGSNIRIQSTIPIEEAQAGAFNAGLEGLQSKHVWQKPTVTQKFTNPLFASSLGMRAVPGAFDAVEATPVAAQQRQNVGRVVPSSRRTNNDVTPTSFVDATPQTDKNDPSEMSSSRPSASNPPRHTWAKSGATTKRAFVSARYIPNTTPTSFTSSTSLPSAVGPISVPPTPGVGTMGFAAGGAIGGGGGGGGGADWMRFAVSEAQQNVASSYGILTEPFFQFIKNAVGLAGERNLWEVYANLDSIDWVTFSPLVATVNPDPSSVKLRSFIMTNRDDPQRRERAFPSLLKPIASTAYYNTDAIVRTRLNMSLMQFIYSNSNPKHYQAVVHLFAANYMAAPRPYGVKSYLDITLKVKTINAYRNVFFKLISS